MLSKPSSVVDAVVVTPGGSVASSTPAHACAVPGSDEQLWEISASYIADGLAANDRIVYFSDGTAEAVLERLADDEVPYEEALERGQLEIVPTEATRAILSGPVGEGRAAVRASIDEALSAGYSGWRMTGEMSHGLKAQGGIPLSEYDRAVAAEIVGRPARLLCLYDRRRYPEPSIAEMLAIHEHEISSPAVYDDSLLRVTRTGVGSLRVAGQADHSNHGTIDRLVDVVLDETLRHHSGPVAVTVDASSLRFLDVAGAAGLIRAAEQFPSTHRLVLRGVRPRVLRVLDRCGAPFAPQLDVLARAERRP